MCVCVTSFANVRGKIEGRKSFKLETKCGVNDHNMTITRSILVEKNVS